MEQITVFDENFFTKCFNNWPLAKVKASRVFISGLTYPPRENQSVVRTGSEELRNGSGSIRTNYPQQVLGQHHFDQKSPRASLEAQKNFCEIFRFHQLDFLVQFFLLHRVCVKVINNVVTQNVAQSEAILLMQKEFWNSKIFVYVLVFS